MAISALAPVSGASLLPRLGAVARVGRLGLAEAPGGAQPPDRVAAIPALRARYGEEDDETGPAGLRAGFPRDPGAAAAAPGDARSGPGLDPRRPDWILGPRSAAESGGEEAGEAAVRGQPRGGREGRAGEGREGTGPSRRELGDRLAELLGEKARGERKRAAGRNEGAAETLRVIGQLKARDAEVRAHEAAHMGAGGRYVTGGASYAYQRGPDGRQYAVGGEVGIDTSPVPGRPEETAAKMRTVRAAALAPSEPSAADLAVAAAAYQAEIAASAEAASARAASLAARYSPEGARGASRPAALDMVA
jgi:hypothetical protein